MIDFNAKQTVYMPLSGHELTKSQTQGQIDIEELQLQVKELLLIVDELTDRLERLESKGQ